MFEAMYTGNEQPKLKLRLRETYRTIVHMNRKPSA